MVVVSEVTRYEQEGAVREAPSEGVYVHGLYLDGCAWDAKAGRLVDSEPKARCACLEGGMGGGGEREACGWRAGGAAVARSCPPRCLPACSARCPWTPLPDVRRS